MRKNMDPDDWKRPFVYLDAGDETLMKMEFNLEK